MNKTLHTIHCIALFAAVILMGASIRAGDDQSASQAASQERELIGVLKSGSPAEKAIACKRLATLGTEAAVPELARLLTDEQLASWARIALEAIPATAADEALRKATETLQGKLLIGTINSIGVRRDAGSVQILTGRLQDGDTPVAEAAAVALGRIANDAATQALRTSLADGPAKVRTAVAEGCILCAERLLSSGKNKEAVEIYDEVRRADVRKPRVLEATRGAILARKSEGIPLLIEQLRSSDKGFFQIGLGAARELPGREVADALAVELVRTTPERASLLLYALADRKEAAIPQAVLAAAKAGEKPVRMAAIGFVGRLGDASHLNSLLEIATEPDAELTQAAKGALAQLSDEKVDAELSARLTKADGKVLPVLIEVVGLRRIEATAALRKALDHSDATVRSAALTALGATVGPKDLNLLIAQTVTPKKPGDAQAARQALREASVRMPDREACAAELAAAMQRAASPTKTTLLEILAAVGGKKSLETIGAAAKTNDEELQDAGTRLLGEWMSVDAGPVLLDLVKTSSSEKFRGRALKGYIRLARQFPMPDRQRAEMCQFALDVSKSPDEQKLVLTVLERYPSAETLRVATKAAETPALKEGAGRVALAIGLKLVGDSAEARELLTKIGAEPVKLEIVKAVYGAGTAQKDVTDVLQKFAGTSPLVILSKPIYNESLGGDPAPNTKKELHIQYRINGKAGQATFAENAIIVLPMPK